MWKTTWLSMDPWRKRRDNLRRFLVCRWIISSIFASLRSLSLLCNASNFFLFCLLLLTDLNSPREWILAVFFILFTHMCEYINNSFAHSEAYKFRCISTFFKFTNDALDWIDLCKLIALKTSLVFYVRFAIYAAVVIVASFFFSLLFVASQISHFFSIKWENREDISHDDNTRNEKELFIWKKVCSFEEVIEKRSWFLSDLILTHSANTQIEIFK